ncbi:MAG: aromatic ring-hydroxylating oxygenase subunit alpha, partial [Planctomycetaceae bacterium]
LVDEPAKATIRARGCGSMFLSDTHLPQVLTADEYTSAAQFRQEMERLILPAWQLVGTTAQLPRDGDYFTFELFDRPLIVWRCGETIRAFLNVCPHRFSRITSRESGHTGERLTCQYHGWEYDCEGQTRKIPDARSFRPMSKGALCLKTYRTETCGQLIFVNFDDDPPPLAEFLAPHYETTRRLFSEDRRMFERVDIEVAANWKIKVENAMESYHVDQIHPQTFGRIPEAEACFHEFGDMWSTFATVEETENRGTQLLDNLIHRLARVEPDLEYKHFMFYPTFMYIKMRLFTWVETVIPLAPDRTRLYTIVFCHGGNAARWRSRLVTKLLAGWGRAFINKVAREDAGIIPEVQRGLAAAERPSTGVVSIREERCFHFQEYIRRSLPRDSEAGPTSDLTERLHHVQS